MVGGYGEPQEQLPATAQQGQYPDEYYNDPNMGYQYPGDMWAGRPPSDQSAQVRKAIFDIDNMPQSDDDWRDWKHVMGNAIDAVARIPGIDNQQVRKLQRKFKFILMRAHSEGSRSITETKMQEFLFDLRSLVAQGDTPIAGLTGVGAMITTHTKGESTVRYPNQQPASFGLLDLIPWRRK